MASNDALLNELLSAAGANETDIGERGFRRLMLAATTNVYQKVNEMPNFDKRLTRLEWIVGLGVGMMAIAAAAIINGVLSGRILITIVP